MWEIHICEMCLVHKGIYKLTVLHLLALLPKIYAQLSTFTDLLTKNMVKYGYTFTCAIWNIRFCQFLGF
jgi:hypothetical protein